MFLCFFTPKQRQDMIFWLFIAEYGIILMVRPTWHLPRPYVAHDVKWVWHPWDRSNTSATHCYSLAANTLKQYMSDFGLSDTWCSNPPSHEENTFLSRVQHSYLSLDFFLISNSLLADICNPLNHHQSSSKPWNWRFNT